MTGGLAKRYARALASVAKEETGLEEMSTELERVAGWLADEELSDALSSPALTQEQRQALVTQISESLNLAPLCRNFLALLTDKGRLHYFEGIRQAYSDLVDKELNQLRATLRTAMPLTSEQEGEIAAMLEKTHGKKILLASEVDPALVAGVTIEIEGKIYDGSARTQLVQVARAMAHGNTSG